jgi:hypothetical protein
MWYKSHPSQPSWFHCQNVTWLRTKNGSSTSKHFSPHPCPKHLLIISILTRFNLQSLINLYHLAMQKKTVWRIMLLRPLRFFILSLNNIKINEWETTVLKKTNTRSISEEISHIYWGPQLNCHFRKTKPMSPIMSQLNPDHIFIHYFLNFSFNIILQFILTYSKWSLLAVF